MTTRRQRCNGGYVLFNMVVVRGSRTSVPNVQPGPAVFPMFTETHTQITWTVFQWTNHNVLDWNESITLISPIYDCSVFPFHAHTLTRNLSNWLLPHATDRLNHGSKRVSYISRQNVTETNVLRDGLSRNFHVKVNHVGLGMGLGKTGQP